MLSESTLRWAHPKSLTSSSFFKLWLTPFLSLNLALCVFCLWPILKTKRHLRYESAQQWNQDVGGLERAHHLFIVCSFSFLIHLLTFRLGLGLEKKKRQGWETLINQNAGRTFEVEYYMKLWRDVMMGSRWQRGEERGDSFMLRRAQTDKERPHSVL